MKISLLLVLIFLCGACAPKVQTNPEKYPKLLKQWQSSGQLADHFPQEIPRDATGVRFSEFPGMMQAGAHLQLRYSLAPDEVLKVYERASKEAKDFYDGGHSLSSTNSKGLAGTDFHTSSDGMKNFPEDYRIFVLFAQPYKPGDWNHGQSKGVVVSTQRNEIVYFAENW